MTSNHLDISYVKCMEVASLCVCVCDRSSNALFNTFVSSTKVFVSNAKRVRLQDQNCSSPAQNAFVASDKRVPLQSILLHGTYLVP